MVWVVSVLMRNVIVKTDRKVFLAVCIKVLGFLKKIKDNSIS